jgi:hypothetical protein
MRDLNFQLKQMCQRNLEGSYATRTARERILALVANQLHGLGFHHLAVQGLKPKHVDALVQRWTAEDLSAGTIKNRMSALRWWAEKIAKQNVVARANDHYGIAERRYVTNESKARVLSTGDLAKIADPHLCLSLRFQAAFGLRREESLKIRPAVADRGEVLALQASWTKGGRAREIPIHSDEQRAVLAEAKRLVGQGSLIPANLNYVAQLRSLRASLRAGGYSPRSRSSTPLRPAALPGTHRMGGAGGRRAQVTGADAEPEGGGSGGAHRHQPRAWA